MQPERLADRVRLLRQLHRDGHGASSRQGHGAVRIDLGQVDAHAEVAIAIMDLRAALDRLEPEDRALLAMRYVAGFDSNELAAALGISPSGVRSRIERIRTRLREELGDD